MHQIEKYLTRDEMVEKTFKLKDCHVYATNKRLFITCGRTIRDFAYNYISSVGYENKRYYKYIAIGVILIFLGLLLSGVVIGVLGVSIGLIVIIISILYSREYLEITVLGLSEPIRFYGARSDLDSLLTIIREKRV